MEETTNDAPPFGDAGRDGQEGEAEEEKPRPSRFFPKPLPERVCELFLMQDFNAGGRGAESPFFRSEFMREKLPQMLFSNGACGFGAGAEGVVRNIPIRVLNTTGSGGGKEERQDMASSGGRTEGNGIGMEGAGRDKELPDRFSLMSSPELRRHFASLFWTPQQARRIAEREEQKQRQNGAGSGGEEEPGKLERGLGGGSRLTIYSIPIAASSPGERAGEEPVGTGGGGGAGFGVASRDFGWRGQAPGPGPYSAVPFKRRAGMNSAQSSPSLFPSEPGVNRGKPPLPPPASSPSTSFPARQAQTGQPQPPLRRTQTSLALPQSDLPRRDSEPRLSLAEDGLVLLEQSAQSNSLANMSADRSAFSAEGGQSSPISTSGSISSSSESPSKSSSLAALRQSLLRLRASSRKTPTDSSSSLLPPQQSSGSDQQGPSSPAELAGRRPSRNGHCLAASSLHLTEFVPRQGDGREKEVDAVEEAIRSLEQFDPSDFVQRQYHGRPAAMQQRQGPGPRVFLARAEAVPGRGAVPSSAMPFERRSSLSVPSPSSSSEECGSSSPPALPPSLLFTRRPSNATISSGSVTPTQPPAHFQSDGPPAFGHSFDLDSSSRTPRANSPVGDGLPEMDQLISRLRGQQRRAVTFSDQPSQHFFYSPLDGPPPDYSESGGSGEEGEGGSLADSEGGEPNNAAAQDAEAQLRKRFLCSQLTDCAKVIEINALKMGQFVAAGSGLGGWRQPHILRHNLGAIRDTIYTVEFALDELVESLGRVSLDQRDPRRASLGQLAQPVRTSLAMLRRLRASLDSTGWSLSALALPRGAFLPPAHLDALDQFAAILPQLPKDCKKLVQWVYSLPVWPDPRSGQPSALFLPASASSGPRPGQHPPPPPPAPLPPKYQNGGTGQPRPASPSSSLQNYYSSGEEEAREKVARGEEVMDGGESTSSTTSSVQTLGKEAEGEGEGALVLEEDDLASVVSECAEGHWQDLAGPHSAPGPALHRRVNAELSRSLAPDQKDLFRLYESQVAAHVSATCALIEEFFSLVEANKEPKLSLHKIQMIYIEGHSLCDIIRVLGRDEAISRHRPLNAFLEHESAKLDSLLNECLAAAKVAKTKAQNWTSRAQTVPAVQSMCQAVVAVSESTSQIRAFWRNCARG